ncbi:MAG: aminotransferase class V-fold PLP-dependent enzyme, partial [Phycisphaerae bacterium]
MDWNALREEFPVTRNYNFQNHAFIAPISRRASDAAAVYFEQARENGYVEGGFYKHAEHVRRLAADLINANSDEVTFIKNTSEGINFVANG